MSKTKETSPQKKMGKNCGFWENADGSISPAPTYVDQFVSLFHERAGIDNVLRTITSHAAEVHRSIAARQKMLWDLVVDDYGIDLTKVECSFDFNEKSIKIIAKSKESAEGKGEKRG